VYLWLTGLSDAPYLTKSNAMARRELVQVHRR
jgi:hypothetical protein